MFPLKLGDFKAIKELQTSLLFFIGKYAVNSSDKLNGEQLHHLKV